MAAAQRARLVLGNWKMNGNASMAEGLLGGVREGLAGLAGADARAGVCPPFPYLALAAARLSGSAIGWGAQDVSSHDDGAYTGEVSARMLADLGCTWALVGHSERRSLFGDTDDEVARKAARALAAGIVPVVCVGESRAERESGTTEAVLARQLDAVMAVLRDAGGRCVLAYEPVWAIGTGLTASPQQAQDAHAFIRARLAGGGVAEASMLPLLYGGSVKASNAAELFSQPDVDGGLIGGASLVAADFVAIVRAAVRRG